MKTLLKDGHIFTAGGFVKKDIYLDEGRVFVVGPGSEKKEYDETVACKGLFIVPGFADVHVHFREPGFFYKETIKTGSMAAAKGGYTAVCTMPNLNPPPADPESLALQQELIRRDSRIKIYPYGAITSDQSGRGKLSSMEDIAGSVVAFTDDGKGIQSVKLMEAAMIKAKALGKIIVAHCEDESLLSGGYIHDGKYASDHVHKGISSESEWTQAARDIDLSKKTGCSYHICHVSTKETVELVRQAKEDGLDVTCETAPHYLVLCDEDLKEEGRFKMNPPLRSREDKEALLEGIKDGTVDMIATDHAPHSPEEKTGGLKDSLFGITGLETAFGILNKYLVGPGIISRGKLIELLSITPRKRFGLEGGYIEESSVADLAVLDFEQRGRVDPETFLSKGKSTPFEGMEYRGENTRTFVNGKKVWEKKSDRKNI